MIALSYSAFGERCNGATWSGAPSAAAWTVIGNTTHQGFTGHEHLDNVGLIHMNGRVFDPMLGQFTSADPFVQAPFEPQSLNRYSYVFNDPLSLVDPSGFCGATAVNLFDNTPGILDPRGNDPSDPNPHASANGNTDYGSNQPSFNTPCPQSELELYNSIGALLRAQEQEGTPIQVYSIRESGQNATLGLVSTSHGIAGAAQAGRGIGSAGGGTTDIFVGQASGGIPMYLSVPSDIATDVQAAVLEGQELALEAGLTAAPVPPLLRGIQIYRSWRALRQINHLVDAANVPIAKGGLSAAARALSKHSQRAGGTFARVTGNVAQRNAQAERVLRGILSHPGAARTNLSRGGFEIRLPNGQGVRYDAGDVFSGFLDPPIP